MPPFKCDAQVIAILTLSALADSMYSLIAPFLPIQYIEKGVEKQWIGAIFATYSVAVIMFSPIAGWLMPYCGRRNLIAVGLLLMGQTSAMFGLSFAVNNKVWFIVIQVINRFAQGVASALVQTCLYSIATNFYPDHKERMIGYIEATQGAGLALGPFLGSGLYAIGGNKAVFFSFATFFIVSAPFIRCLMNPEVDGVSGHSAGSRRSASDRSHLADDEEPLMARSNQNSRRPINICILLGYPRVAFAAFNGFMAYFAFCYQEPILAFRVEEFNLSQIQIGLFFCILPIFYITSSTIVNKVPNGVQKRAIMITSLVLFASFNFLNGPSKLLHFPDKLWLIGVA